MQRVRCRDAEVQRRYRGADMVMLRRCRGAEVQIWRMSMLRPSDADMEKGDAEVQNEGAEVQRCIGVQRSCRGGAGAECLGGAEVQIW